MNQAVTGRLARLRRGVTSIELSEGDERSFFEQPCAVFAEAAGSGHGMLTFTICSQATTPRGVRERSKAVGERPAPFIPSA